jgi:acetyl esterase/lipase
MDDHTTCVALYEGAAPGSEDWHHEERAYFSEIFNTEVVTNVSVPTLTPFLPDAGNGTAVIIAPGGGFHALSINSEGNDVARWLSERGVAAFVLRYRTVPSGEDAVAEMVSKSPEQASADMQRIAPLAGADGLAAMRLVRARADDFGADPARVGFLGFSAGGAVTMTVALGYDEATRPAFVAPIYAGAGRWNDQAVPDDAPPMFLVAASDDQLGLARDSVALYEKWLAAGKPVEMHLYAQGGHGFGMRRQHLPADTWIERLGEWLAASGLLAAQN